jgi:hypothetical protein
LGVGGVAGVEIGGVGFDDEEEVGGVVGGVGAGGEEEGEEKYEESVTQRAQRRRGRRCSKEACSEELKLRSFGHPCRMAEG